MAIDVTNIFRKYPGKWVGLKDNKKTVIASGNSPQEVLEKSRKKGFQNPLLFRIPNKITHFVGGVN